MLRAKPSRDARIDCRRRLAGRSRNDDHDPQCRQADQRACIHGGDAHNDAGLR